MNKKRVIIITGANNGIGLGLARALHSMGDHVACFDLSSENLADLNFYKCDVSDPDQVISSTERVLSVWGHIDILVNNACLAIFSPFEEKQLTDTRLEFEVNYFGYVNMIKAVLPAMKAQGGGIIHNFSSTVGTTGFAGIYGYSSTKGAIEAMSRTLAIEFAHFGIIVNIIHPPLTRTNSSAPLGVPVQFMKDPFEVGKKLAGKIGSTKPVITPGTAESAGVFLSRICPVMMGRFMSKKAAEARNNPVVSGSKRN